MQYLITRRNESDKPVYYKYFDGRHGSATSKKQAPRFDRHTADMIARQLAALDNRGWTVVEDAV